MILSDKKLPVILRVRMAHVYKTKQSSIRGPKCVNRVYLGSRSVAAVGIRILAGVHVNRRSSIIIAVSLGLGLSVTFAPDILRSLPELLSHTLSSGIATGGTRVLVPNTVFPGERCLVSAAARMPACILSVACSSFALQSHAASWTSLFEMEQDLKMTNWNRREFIQISAASFFLNKLRTEGMSGPPARISESGKTVRVEGANYAWEWSQETDRFRILDKQGNAAGVQCAPACGGRAARGAKRGPGAPSRAGWQAISSRATA